MHIFRSTEVEKDWLEKGTCISQAGVDNPESFCIHILYLSEICSIYFFRIFEVVFHGQNRRKLR